LTKLETVAKLSSTLESLSSLVYKYDPRGSKKSTFNALSLGQILYLSLKNKNKKGNYK